MKKLFLLSALAVFCLLHTAKAQVTYAKIDEFQEIKKRPLIVEMIELDKDVVEKWEKKRSKTKDPEKAAKYKSMIQEYKSYVDSYNSFMKKAMESHWKLNDEFVYKTTSEVKKLRKDKSEKYAVLWFSQSESNAASEYGTAYFPDLTIPTLNYGRIEASTVAVDYSFFMPYTGYRNDNNVNYGDMVLCVKLMQNHINTMIKMDKRKYTFKSYADDQAKENCSELKGKKVYLPEPSIHKRTTLSEIKTAYHAEVKSISEEELNTIITEEEDKVIALAIPFGIVGGSLGPMSSARIMFLKVLVNAKTGEIYTCKGTSPGEFNDQYFRDKEFEKYGVDCN